MPNVITGTGASENLPGTAGPDSIVGLGGNDTLMGNEGEDTLDGGHGDDLIDGGDDNDLLLSGEGNDTYQGQRGGDTLSYAPSPSAVFVTKPQTGTTPGSASDGFGGTDIIHNGTADLLIGSSFNDTLIGSPIYTSLFGEVFGSDFIEGGGGDDSISGQSGDDDLAGNHGNDTIDGGAGIDIAVYLDAPGSVTVNLLAGTATGADGSDQLIGIEGVAGSGFDDSLTGDAGNNWIAGLGGNDTLNGGAGTDVAVYAWESLGAVSVDLSLGVALGIDGNDLLSNFESAWGTDFADTLVGDAGANELIGNLGDDTLRGGGGNDTLNGGTTGDTADHPPVEDEALEVDVAVFSGNRADYILSYNSTSGQLSVTDKVLGRDGTDTLFSIEALEFADQTVEQDITTGRIDPWSTYLSTSVNDGFTFGQGVWLEDIGLAPGDIVTITTLGFYARGGSNMTETASGILAVFADFTDFFAPPVFTPFVSLPQAITNVPTDIPEDFFLSLGGTTLVQIPDGALMILFSPNDSFFSDNFDNNDDFRVVGRRFDAATTFTGNDQLFGTWEPDTLLGGTGRDTLIGSSGDDLLDGGVITDRVNYTDLNVLSYASSAAAVNINLSGIQGNGSVGRGTVLDGWGDTDTVANVNFITASAHNDVILGSTATIFEEFTPGAGNDTVDGGVADPVLQNNTNRVNYAASSGAMTVNFSTGTASGGNQGTDTLVNIQHVRGSAHNDTLTGSNTTFTEQFEGAAGNDTIDGLGGIDIVRYDSATTGINANLVTGVVLDGLGGTDTLFNIEGVRASHFADTLTGGNPANGTGVTDGFENFIGQGGNDTIDGGGGYDRIDFTTSTAGAVVDFAAGTAQDGLGGIDTFANIEAVRGSAFNDVLNGSDGGVFESFEGREGNDTIDGKGGVDRIDYQFNDRAMTINLAAGTAIDYDVDAFGLPAVRYTDSFLNIENVRGSSFGDLLLGSAADNRFDPLDGDDTVEGLAGNDTIVGSFGIDTLTYANSPSAVTLTVAQDATSQGTASDGFGGVDIFDRGASNIVVGSAFGDVLTGADVYFIDFFFGADTIHGGGGNDSIVGNGGNDKLFGDAGNDTLLGGDGDDQLRGGAGDDTIDGGAGIDTAYFDEAASGVAAHIGANTSLGGSGSDLLLNIEKLMGSAFNDTLTGGANNDTIGGGLGNDTLAGGNGTDEVYYGNAAAGVTVNLALGTATGGDGTDSLSAFENIMASAFADVLVGTSTGNLIQGGAGNDSIDGGAGNDTLDGGLGDDTLDGGTGSDIARFSGNFDAYSIGTTSTPGELQVVGPDGRDRLRNIEVLQFADRTLTMVFGTEASEVLTAQAAAGPVVIDAGGGNDTLIANNSGNALLGGAGTDQLIGGDGNDNLDGGTGNDTMTGGAGDDVYIVDSVGDVVIEGADPLVAELVDGSPLTVNVGGGSDTVISDFSYTLGNFLENLKASADAGNFTGTGNALNNIVTGNAGNDTLDGRTGADTVNGGDGNDTLMAGVGNDTLDGGNGRDFVQFSGNRDAYSLTFGDTAITVSGPDGTDLLTNVERFSFSGNSYMAFDTLGNGGQAYRLYQAAFDRTPDIGGLGFQINALDIGFQLVDISANFIESPEFLATYGSVDNGQFVDLLYQNVLDRLPDPGGHKFHKDNLDAGLPRNYLLAQFSESPENQANVIGAIASGMSYTL